MIFPHLSDEIRKLLWRVAILTGLNKNCNSQTEQLLFQNIRLGNAFGHQESGCMQNVKLLWDCYKYEK